VLIPAIFFIYLSVCRKPGKWAVMYLYVRGTKPGKWAVMYLYVRGTKPGKWTVMYLCVRGTKPGKWTVMYLYVRGTKPGKWTVMYLYVRDIDIVPSYTFPIRFWNCPDNGIFIFFFNVLLEFFRCYRGSDERLLNNLTIYWDG
jgi:hypothetical protein